MLTNIMGQFLNVFHSHNFIYESNITSHIVPHILDSRYHITYDDDVLGSMSQPHVQLSVAILDGESSASMNYPSKGL